MTFFLMSSNSGVGTRVCLTPQVGAGMQMQMWVTGGMWASCSQWWTWACKAESSFSISWMHSSKDSWNVATGGVGGVLTKSEFGGAGARVGAGGCRWSHVGMKATVPWRMKHMVSWICSKVYGSLGKWSGNLSWSQQLTWLQSPGRKPWAKARWYA